MASYHPVESDTGTPDENAPVLLFVYNRPQHTRRVLEALASNPGAEKSELIIYCDAARRPEDEEAVKAVRSIIRSRQWCGSVTIVEQERNLGLAKSVILGVSEVVNRFGKVIVLEDDLILSPQFLQYMNSALTLYQDDPRVMHVAGYMFPVQGQGLPDTFFLRLATCWGWATWRDAWDKFNPDGNALRDQIHQKGLVRSFNLDGAANYDRMLCDQIAGRNNSWAIRWYASMLLNNGFGLHPRFSLVQNGGFDGTGEHCTELRDFDTDLATAPLEVRLIAAEEYELARKAIRHFYQQKGRFTKKVGRRLAAWTKRFKSRIVTRKTESQ